MPCAVQVSLLPSAPGDSFSFGWCWRGHFWIATLGTERWQAREKLEYRRTRHKLNRDFRLRIPKFEDARTPAFLREGGLENLDARGAGPSFLLRPDPWSAPVSAFDRLSFSRAGGPAGKLLVF